MSKTLFSLTIIVFALFATVYGQQREEDERVRRERQRVQDARDDFSKYTRVPQDQITPATPHPGKAQVERQSKVIMEKAEIVEEIKRQFSPSENYYQKYAGFLKQKDTGIARMMPDKNCGKGLIVDVAELERCKNAPPIAGGGSLYSLRLYKIPAIFTLEYILGFIQNSDMRLIGNQLLMGNSSTQDIVADVGQTNIADVSQDSEPVKFLNDFKRAKNRAGFTSQKQQVEQGIVNNGILYSSKVQIKPSNTYVFRSIAYNIYAKSFWNTDFTAAFQIVGYENDGSIIFIWKKLREKDAPPLNK